MLLYDAWCCIHSLVNILDRSFLLSYHTTICWHSLANGGGAGGGGGSGSGGALGGVFGAATAAAASCGQHQCKTGITMNH